MAGVGSEAVGGLAALQATIRQRMMDQIAQQERDRSARQQDVQNEIQMRQLAMQEAQHRDAAQRAVQQERDTAAAKVPLSLNDTVEAPQYQRIFAGTSTEPLFTQQTTLPAMQTGGGAALDRGEAAPSTTSAAIQSPTGRYVFAGTDKQRSDEEKKQLLGRLLDDPNLSAREKLALQYEQTTGKNPPAGVFEPKGPQNLVQVDEGGKPVYRPASEAAGKPAYHQPQQTATVTIQTVDDKGRPVTRVVPKGEAIGKDYAKGPSAVTENRLDSAKAVAQTGNDIIAQASDPAVAAALGPAMGRFNTLREFIGNPPPELSELAGSIESYALASMGVHGMRSAQGAEQIKALLDRKHTPESLIRTIRGLNKFSQHFMENAGRDVPQEPSTPQPSASAPKATAADLIKKYGG